MCSNQLQDIVNKLHTKELSLNNLLTSGVLNESIIEYIDPDEQNKSLICFEPNKIKKELIYAAHDKNFVDETLNKFPENDEFFFPLHFSPSTKPNAFIFYSVMDLDDKYINLVYDWNKKSLIFNKIMSAKLLLIKSRSSSL